MSIKINKKKKLQQLEQVANLSTYPSQHFNSFCYDDDDDDDEEYTTTITPVLPTEEPDNSLSMEDEHLSTILETESDELIKSSVENLVPIPSESEDFSDIENPHHFNAESDLIESLINRDISIVSLAKFDSLLEEFSSELAHIDLISPEIDEADFDTEEEICLVEKLYDSLMEEIDIFLAPNDSIPPGIKNENYDLEGDILFLKELLSNDPLSLPENESFHFDHYYVPSSSHPPEKPPDDDDVYFDIEP
ncbi:hypothetical protein Tco_1389315, partial [Tanacetum coccineum]